MKPKHKNDHSFLAEKKSFIQIIKKVLRQEYNTMGAAIKRIQADTEINERAIRNWYEGKNIPSTMHLILLARIYPSIFHAFLRLAGHDYLTSHVFEKNVPENVTDELTPGALNNRQRWILMKLALMHKLQVRDVAHIWAVSDRTAKRDFGDLKLRGYIVFKGSKKQGRYLLAEHADAVPFSRKGSGLFVS